MRRGSNGGYNPSDPALVTVDPPTVQPGAGLLSVDLRAPVTPTAVGGGCGFITRRGNPIQPVKQPKLVRHRGA